MPIPVSFSSFCSVLSAAGDEPLAGTAWNGVQYIFISWSKKWWAKRQYESQHFSSSLSSYLQSLQKERGVFTRLIYQRNQKIRKNSQIFIMPDGLAYEDVSVTEIEDVLRRYFEGKPDGKYQRTKTKGAYIFCCTHGKRDKCCAKFGQQVVYELERLALEKSFDAKVWECTHIAGDRFAATAIAFPHGFMYGRIRESNTAEIIDHLIEGAPYPFCYRGKLGLNPIEQVAEAFGHFYWFEKGIKNVKVRVIRAIQHSVDEAEASVAINDKDSDKTYAEFNLTLRKKEFLTYIDCHSIESHEMRKVSRWIISDVKQI